MNFMHYQSAALKTAMYPSGGVEGLAYACLGLNGEAGEVAEKIKKIVRDTDAIESKENLDKAIELKREDIVKELGDVLWYVAAMCYELGVTMEEVAEANIEKLSSRKKRNAITGSGDNR